MCIAITSIKETITEVKEGVEKLSLTAGREAGLEVQLEEAVKEKKEALYEGDLLKEQLVKLLEERDNMLREIGHHDLEGHIDKCDIEYGVRQLEIDKQA